MDKIDNGINISNDRISDIEQMLQMVDLKMKAEKKTKFVQFYPDMVKQVESVINKVKD